MAATEAEIARVRRMVNEPTTETYSDDDIADAIERYPLIDERGAEPYTWDVSTSPPTRDWNEDWIPTYDLNAAAADLWGEKAAVVAQDYTFSADGGSYSRADVLRQYQERERYYRARRRANTTRMVMSPSPGDAERPGWLINIAEEDE